MAIRPPDVIELRGRPGVLARFSEVELTTSLVAPTQARFTIGDDRAWSQLERDIQPGAEYELTINGIRILKGRVVADEIPMDPGKGASIELHLSTKLSDAMYASADPSIKAENTTLEDFVVALFAQHGYTRADFLFATRANVDLITGAPKKGGLRNPDLSLMTVAQARAQMPETVWECATRHVQRHGMQIWDMPDGRIMIGAPDDSAEPNFTLRARRRGAVASANNLMVGKRLRDWREVASEVSVYGQRKAQEVTGKSVRADATDDEVAAVARGPGGHFFRPIRLPTERAKNPTEAEKVARRELATRVRRKDGFEFQTDGWSYWNGQRAIVWAIGGVVGVESDVTGVASGAYMIWRLLYKMTPNEGQRVQGVLIARGLWDLGGME